MGRHIIDSVNVKMTKDSSSNSVKLRQMSTSELFQSSDNGMHYVILVEQSTNKYNRQVLVMPNLIVGLNNLLNDFKQILLGNGVNIVG